MIIRKATIEDAKAIRAVTKEAFLLYQKQLGDVKLSALTETVDDIILDIKNHLVLVAIDEKNKILGTIRCKDLDNSSAYIFRFAVDNNATQFGIGSKLLDIVIENCKVNNKKTISLHTATDHKKLVSYYVSKGFSEVSSDVTRGYRRSLLECKM